VSKFRKEQMGRIKLLNPWMKLRTVYPPAVCPYFSVRLPSRTYGIFMNRSGLSDGHFVTLIPAVGRVVPRGLWLSSS